MKDDKDLFEGSRSGNKEMWADIKDVKDKRKTNMSWFLTGCDGEKKELRSTPLSNWMDGCGIH